MNPLSNPFNPGAGISPPELAGRESVLDQAVTALGRTQQGRYAKALLILGLRGVGKTVLLSALRREALAHGFLVAQVEADDGAGLRAPLARALRDALLALTPSAGVSGAVKKALRVLRSFIGTITLSSGDVSVSLGVDPEPGAADSGHFEPDVRDVLLATARAAQAAKTPVVLLADEMQYIPESELAALIRGLHAVNQEGLPLLLFGAGLPQLAGHVGGAKTYAERMFDFRHIGGLPKSDAGRAIRAPVEAGGAKIDDGALAEIYTQTRGYPYFLQEWGYHAWNLARRNVITRADAAAATTRALSRLDQSFFLVRFDRLAPNEQVYLRELAALDEDDRTSAAVATRMRRSTRGLSSTRARLIRAGLIYAPAWGRLAFTVPLFDEFMRRKMPSSPDTP